jgi:hypothetical protein
LEHAKQFNPPPPPLAPFAPDPQLPAPPKPPPFEIIPKAAEFPPLLLPDPPDPIETA